MAHRVRRLDDAARDGPRGQGPRHGRQPCRTARGDHGLEAGHRLQPAGGIPGHRHLRPVRGGVSRADAASLHGLQSARNDDLARQGPVEAGPRLSPHPDRALRAAAAQPPVSRAEATRVPAVRQVGDRGRIVRDRAGIDRARPAEAARARRVHPRADELGRAGRGVHRGSRALHRRDRQRAADDLSRLGARLRHAAGGDGGDRDPQGQVGRQVPAQARHRHRARRRTFPRPCRRAWRRSRGASTARSC